MNRVFLLLIMYYRKERKGIRKGRKKNKLFFRQLKIFTVIFSNSCKIISIGKHLL